MFDKIIKELTIITALLVIAVVLIPGNVLMGSVGFVAFVGAVIYFMATPGWFVDHKSMTVRFFVSHVVVTLVAMLWIGMTGLYAWTIATAVAIYLIVYTGYDVYRLNRKANSDNEEESDV